MVQSVVRPPVVARPGAVTAARVWNTILAVVILASMIIQSVLLVRGGQDPNAVDAAKVSVGTSFVRFFSYFTVESNLIVLASAITLALNPLRDGRFWRVLHLAALLAIVITGLVFDFILAKLVHAEGWAAVTNYGFHYFAPWFMLLGWLLFGPRPRIAWSTIPWAFVWPIAWIIYTFVRGGIVHWYPYPFMNVEQHGFWTALGLTSMVVVLGIVLAFLFKWLDRLPTLIGPSRQITR